MALMQNCKMPNASSNSTAVVPTEHYIPGAALERRKPEKNLKMKKPVQPRLDDLGAIMNTTYVEFAADGASDAINDI